jgi:hypothetical protein
MFRSIGLCLGTLVRLLRARRSLLLENLALRQQLAVLKRRHPRPRLDLLDKPRKLQNNLTAHKSRDNEETPSSFSDSTSRLSQNAGQVI